MNARVASRARWILSGLLPRTTAGTGGGALLIFVPFLHIRPTCDLLRLLP
ncbi:hypothetical protein SAMN05428945_2956 [Streptomyces sp. 2224.1]|nr:hypothetical protein SAMN05428945_2956 [Streptomyces sp. 2224.1]